MADNREDIVGRTWLIRKDGYFYRPNKSGYTTSKAEAGRYNEADAKRECEIEPWHMKAIHENEWPDDPVSKDINDKVARLIAENASLRARLETVEAETRERCAKVATDQAYMFIGGPARTVYGQGYQKGCDLVAETIRNLEPRHD